MVIRTMATWMTTFSSAGVRDSRARHLVCRIAATSLATQRHLLEQIIKLKSLLTIGSTRQKGMS